MTRNEPSPLYTIGYTLRAMAIIANAAALELRAGAEAAECRFLSRLERPEDPPATRSSKCFPHDLDK